MILKNLFQSATRFHVAVRLFSNRSQMTSKCGKNISDTLGYASCATFLFLPHFDVFGDLLLNRRMATWNLVVLYNNMENCEQNLALLFVKKQARNRAKKYAIKQPQIL